MKTESQKTTQNPADCSALQTVAGKLWFPHHPATPKNQHARLLNFVLTDPAINCSCLACARMRVILQLPASIIADAAGLSAIAQNVIVGATVRMLTDLELAEDRQRQQQDEDEDERSAADAAFK